LPAINILYQRGGGSQGIDLIQEMPDPKYQPPKRTAIRYMKANCAAPGAIELLEQFPFSLWQATSDFGDNFEVLHLKAGIELYVEIENEVGIWKQRIVDGIQEIVRAFEITGHPVRFVAVELDDSEDVAITTLLSYDWFLIKRPIGKGDGMWLTRSITPPLDHCSRPLVPGASQ